MSESKGWVKLYRQIVDSRVFAKPEILKLWVLCLTKANHGTAWVDIDGLTEPVKVETGQFITGRYSLHREYYPKKISDMKSEITLWRWLQKLEKWGNLVINSHTKYSLIEVCNWDKYQISESSGQQNEHQLNNGRTTGEHQLNTNKNDNNDKNEKEYIALINGLETVKKMDDPLTVEQSKSLIDEYGFENVRGIFLDMENYKPLLKKNKSANLTAQNWLKRNSDKKDYQRDQPKPSYLKTQL